MKKLLITTCLLAFASAASFAQKKDVKTVSYGTPFHKGSNTIALGLGFGSGYGDYYGSVNRSPAILAYYDHGIVDNLGPGNLGIGGILAYGVTRYKYSNGDKATWANAIVGLRGTWHLTILAKKNNKFDPYAGAMAGLRFQSYKDTYYDNHPGIPNYYDNKGVYPTVGLFVGAKYNFAPNFGAWSELGYDVAFFKLGVNFNF